MLTGRNFKYVDVDDDEEGIDNDEEVDVVDVVVVSDGADDDVDAAAMKLLMFLIHCLYWC